MPELIATLAAGIWAGAAIYSAFAEHPAAVKVGVPYATAYFRPMASRAAPMMIVLALIGAVAGLLAWFNSDQVLWLVGALLLAAMFPFTAILIVPTNRRLLKIDPEREPEEAEALHMRWGTMHTWRTVIGSPAFLVFLWALWIGQKA